MAQVSTRYYISETDIAQLVNLGNFPASFTQLFTRDYAALKRDVGSTETRLEDAENRLDGIDDEIEIIIVRLDDHDTYLADLDVRLDAAEATLLDHEIRIDTAETNITTLQDDLTGHIADQTTHGATGDIIGTGDYCTGAIGGTVLLAAAVADAVASAANAALNPNAAGVVYVQADAATWVAMLAEHKTQINLLKTDLNLAIVQLNALLASERTAKQLAP
jgi:hypothetical protein